MNSSNTWFFIQAEDRKYIDLHKIYKKQTFIPGKIYNGTLL